MQTKNNIPEFRIRCSAISQIMTNSRSKSEVLSQTTKTYCQNWLQDHIYNRHIDIVSKYTEKGSICESKGIELVNKRYGLKLEKNTVQFDSEYITGMPDCISKKSGDDIKNCYSHATFPLFEEKLNPVYYNQMQGYNFVAKKDVFYVHYCLIDMPEHLIESEIIKYIRIKNIERSIEIDEMFYDLYTYSDVPIELRVKTFKVERDNDYINSIIERVEQCREYIKTLKY